MLRRETLTETAEPEVVPDWPRRLLARATSARHRDLRANCAAGTAAPDAPLLSVPMAALDVETTGLEASRHEIVGIALVSTTLVQISARYSPQTPLHALWQ